jgi:hypothetical protein
VRGVSIHRGGRTDRAQKVVEWNSKLLVRAGRAKSKKVWK